jgi:hypothetical protein
MQIQKAGGTDSSYAAAACCCVAARAGGVRWVSPTEHRRPAPTRAATVGATHGGALHSPPRRQRVPGTSAAAGGTLCGQACRQPLPVHVCASGFMPRFWRLLAPSPPLALPCRPPLGRDGARLRALSMGRDRPLLGSPKAMGDRQVSLVEMCRPARSLASPLFKTLTCCRS